MLAFEAHYALEHQLDHVYVEIEPEGGEWETLQDFDWRSSWQAHTFELEEYANKTVRLRFRLKTDQSNNDEGIELKNLRVYG